MRIVMIVFSACLIGCSPVHRVYKEPRPGTTSFAEFNEDGEGKLGVIAFRDGTELEGMDFEVADDSLFFSEYNEESRSNAVAFRQALPLQKITKVEVLQAPVRGVIDGFVLGVLGGSLAGMATGKLIDPSEVSYGVAYGLIAGATIGAISGSIIGGNIGHHDVYWFDTTSASK